MEDGLWTMIWKIGMGYGWKMDYGWSQYESFIVTIHAKPSLIRDEVYSVEIYTHSDAEQQCFYICKQTNRQKQPAMHYSPLIARVVSLANLERARMAGPNLNSTNGMNVSRVAMIARINPAYWLPTLWKNCEANSGETAPSVLRMKPWPAMADEEFSP